MSHSRSHFTILVSCRGKILIHYLVKPWFLAALVLGLFAPIVSMGVSSVVALHQRNQDLNRSTQEVLAQIETLDKEIEQLHRRAGLNPQQVSETPAAALAKGGPAQPLEPKEQLLAAKQQIPSLSARLQSTVKPALEKVLKEEEAQRAAYPNGVPTSGVLEVSSDFGVRPGPFGGAFEQHDGIDILGPYGAPILAAADGVVKAASYAGGYGNVVELKHGYGYETLYAHLARINVEKGAPVQRGDVIGYMGSTGRSTGTHLHYSIYQNKKPLDPKLFLQNEQLVYAN